MFNPAKLGVEEMTISPEKPPFIVPDWGVELVRPTKISKAGMLTFGTFPICVIVIGIQVGVVPADTPWVFNVALLPENVPETKSSGVV
jgi:hypothetical protein